MRSFYTSICCSRRWVLHPAACLAIFVTLLVPLVGGQVLHPSASATLKGVVRDSRAQPAANATVHLESKTGSPTLTTRTDSQGTYNFRALSDGSYMLHAESMGVGQAHFGPFTLQSKEVKTIDLTLASVAASGAVPAFYDEPQFTVAGVTQTGNAGGHGSDYVLRTSDALVKATASLSKSSPAGSEQFPSTADLERARAETRARLAHEDKAELHHSLADIEERLSNPLAAVREYQRAVEMEPSESYLFDWGSELLSHRALEPATEVFGKGHRLFPSSERMLLGLGVAEYARGLYDQAVQSLFQASDLNPSDPTPYLFLGKMLGVETAESHPFVEKFARFANIHPDNALANYYYAVSLWKQSKGSDSHDNSARIEELLEKTICLDPSLSAAYLQLGVISSEKGDLRRAVHEYQKAIEMDPTLAEAHYRLAQAYRRTGEKEKAERELQVYDELSKKSAADAERDYRAIQQFVITLRDRSITSPK